uniref:integrase core domain-containing protein n=1 Tax=Undibacterium squillarum TaxID=1131567 RepID=UPI0035AE69C4
MKRWQRQKVGSADIKPGTPWRNGFVEIFKGKLRDECLNRGKFATRWEAKFVNEK